MKHCKYCGRELNDSAEFCKYCGKRLKTISEESEQTKKKKRMVPLIIGILCIALIGVGIIVAVRLLGRGPKPQANKEDYIDANKFFEENADVKSVTHINKSKNRLSEKEVSEYLKDRGFTDYPITTEYSENGDFIEKIEISDSSTKKHPVYETYYVSSKTGTWIISVIDGTIIAFPSSYNMEHSEKVAVVISETKEVVSYDIATNTFFTTVPKETVLKVRVVDKADAKTLDSIDLEG